MGRTRSGEFVDCKFNPVIDCNRQEKGTHCDQCGWNPAVLEKRMNQKRRNVKYGK